MYVYISLKQIRSHRLLTVYDFKGFWYPKPIKLVPGQVHAQDNKLVENRLKTGKQPVMVGDPLVSPGRSSSKIARFKGTKYWVFTVS